MLINIVWVYWLSERLVREEYAPLRGKNVIVGFTASSAIYRSIDLVRKLIRLGAEVNVVLTSESLKLIGYDLVKWAIGRDPYVELTGDVEHIALADWGDALVIAPATLKTLSKIAYGVGDELLPLLAMAMMGRGKRVVVVPTMNVALYNSPQYRRVEEELRKNGVIFIKPFIEENRVKYPPLEDLVHCVDASINRGEDLKGLNVLVTAGPTREHLDPIRVITNPSSGYMGVLIAREAACRGASVDLVHGPLSVKPPYMVEKYSVETTSDMAHTVSRLTSSKNYDIAVFAGAPADFTVLNKSSTKIPSREKTSLTIVLKPAVKVVKSISRQNKPLVNIIFVAETVETHSELVERARMKLLDYGADLSVANIIRKGMGFSTEYIDVCIVDREKHICYGVIRKEMLARTIIDYALNMLRTKRA